MLRRVRRDDGGCLLPSLPPPQDNYYLNNAVYLLEENLRSVGAVEGTDYVVEYGDRAEHCWNGDHNLSNAVSRLRYNTLYLPRMMERLLHHSPEGADLTSWRY